MQQEASQKAEVVRRRNEEDCSGAVSSSGVHKGAGSQDQMGENRLNHSVSVSGPDV